MSGISQLNAAETRFFDSGGQEVAPSLTEASPEPQAEKDESAASAPEATTPETASDTPEKESREGRFVPLQALQEERAEKKQLRDELRQYREWQAQLTQRLQQMPVQRDVSPLPDPQTQPLEYINHVLGNMQANTAELQQWRQQQEQAAKQRSTLHQYASWATSQEREFTKTQPEYHDAYRYAAEARDKELQVLGYDDPGVRAGIVRNNTAEIINNAVQQGRNPAELVWEYARARGFTPKGARAGGDAEAAAKIAAGLQAAGGKLNKGGAGGEGEMSAKDLAGINDPDEFEKAWKRVFGTRR
jgi:hypothetical protein